MAEQMGCLGFLFRLFGLGDDAGAVPYRLTDRFLSKAELSFYHVLRQAVGDQYQICPKVRLTDLFYVPKAEGRASWHGRISQKHVDFVLCDPQTMQPQMAIELDDASHQTEKGRRRDAFVDQVYEAAGLPLVHMPARATYTVLDVAARVAAAARGSVPERPVAAGAQSQAPGAVTPIVGQSGTAPICPKCQVPMVQRIARRGAAAGNVFYGCPNYPRCQEMAPGPKS